MKVRTRRTLPPASRPGTSKLLLVEIPPVAVASDDTRMAEILKNTTDGVFMLDFDWRFIYLNAHACKLIGNGEELLGTNVWDKFPAASKLSFWEHYHRTMDERVPTTFVSYYPEPLNACFEVQSYPTLQGISVFFRNVTQRRKEEERLLLLEQAIAASPMGITITAYEGVHYCPIIYVNPAFEQLTGYSKEEVMGTDCRFLQGSDRQQNARSDMRTAIAQGKPTRVVVRNYRKNGTRFYNEVHLSQVYDRDGQDQPHRRHPE